MKKKIFILFSIFILCFSLAFSIFDRVSFAEDYVTYVVKSSGGQEYKYTIGKGFKPFLVKSYISDKTSIPQSDRFRTYMVFYNSVDRCGFQWGNFQYSVSPSVPIINKDFNTSAEQVAYIDSLLKDPSLIPIDVTTYESSLGSLQLQDSTSWRFLKYEPISGNPFSPTIDGFGCKVKLRTMFQDTTTTGQKYDKIQIMVRFTNIRSQFSGIITHPWNGKLQQGEYFSYYLSELKSPTTVDLQLIDYTKDPDSGKLNKVLYPVFQPAFDKLGLSKPALSNEYWFICDYTICYRPVTTNGKFGDWFYISPEHSSLGYNMIGGIKSMSVTTGTAVSDENPSSLSFNPLPEDSTASRTASGRGETLGDAINDSNNNLIGGSITSGGSLTSNITDLFELFTNMPSIISTIFGWLPPWVLSLFAIGFALFVPIFIYKFVRG